MFSQRYNNAVVLSTNAVISDSVMEKAQLFQAVEELLPKAYSLWTLVRSVIQQSMFVIAFFL